MMNVDGEEEEASFLQNIGRRNPYVINERLSRTVGWSNANNNVDDDYMNIEGNGLDYREATITMTTTMNGVKTSGESNTIPVEKQSRFFSFLFFSYKKGWLRLTLED